MVSCIASTSSLAEEPDSIPPRAGQAFVRALEQPFAATWENVDLRQIAKRITTTRGVTILLDRRIDPSRGHAFTATGEPLGEFLARLADAAGGSASLLGSVAYIGPPEAARRLRTLAYLRHAELTAEGTGVSRARRSELSQPAPFTWDDLSEPGDLIRRLADQRRVAVDGMDLIPYDLWGGVSIPPSTFVDALSLVLIQFDLTFEWTAAGERIRIVPVAEGTNIERSHFPPKGRTPADALAQWREQFPELEGRVVGNGVLVRGTLEQHEALDRLQRGPRNPREAKAPRLKPLAQERYTLRIMNAPVRALLQKLSEPAYGQLTFEYDNQALQDASINLDQRVSFEVRNAPIDQLLKAVFEPLKVAYELDDRTVRLRPVDK